MSSVIAVEQDLKPVLTLFERIPRMAGSLVGYQNKQDYLERSKLNIHCTKYGPKPV